LCRGGGEENSWCWMLHAAQVATRSQYSRNMVATWGRREEARWCLYVARNMLTTWLATWSLDFFLCYKSLFWMLRRLISTLRTYFWMLRSVRWECWRLIFMLRTYFWCCEASDGNVRPLVCSFLLLEFFLF
jgi:hypothetical protein